ncbi:hypothetical protein [Roseateles saccharophilus]|uniref:Uncharacterized protein n=1 Tax=Roseateles saccharophilus TaxID=304 RepID=A0A4R3UW74_ROSSA|nr:hypothetical protein [Roseateles saccharophilus]MDG0832653.1 hypothetical protein [Roseateles saccharophilus]TCU95412.1 hypothetical protein EV671_1015104 [Roseateles saccharophilus]
MLRHSMLTAALLLAALASSAAGLKLRSAHDSEAEKQTVAQLERLLQANDLSRWTITHDIVVDETEIPHSHPVLTLHTRHLRDDELLLSTYVHEQMHWFLAAHPEQTAAAKTALRRLFPKIPVGFPEGSDGADGNYEHLLVVYLEYRADQRLMGELKAREVMQFWADDHYRWIYRQVLREPEKVGAVVKANGLIPGP